MHPFLIKLLLFITLALVGAIFGFKKFWTAPSRVRNWARDLSVSLFVTAYLLCTVEFVFAVFLIQSDGFGFTLSSQKWFDRHWIPINAEGYRDYDHEWTDNVVFIVGDSIVAGHGIDEVEQRFSNQFANHMGTDWTVAIIAQNGWGPVEQLEALRQHEITPDHIVVSYYLNDIQSAAEAHDLRFETADITVSPSALRPIVNQSYLANFVYWRIYRGSPRNSYWDYLQDAFQNPDIWKTHTDDLFAIVTMPKNKDQPYPLSFGRCCRVWPKPRV